MHLSLNALTWLTAILKERFGLTFTLAYRDHALVMQLAGQQGEIVFNQPNTAFLQASTNAPCTSWNAEAEGYTAPIANELPAPCASALPSPLIAVNKEQNQVSIAYDILGLTYWMLNRIEEIGSTELDNHGRFPATSSHAYKHDYLERPIVDEWLNILGQVVQKVWPTVELKKHQFSMKVSHDVDSPSVYSFSSWPRTMKVMAGHLLKRRNIKAFLQAPYIKLTTGKQLHQQDPHNTFDWLMDISEENNLTSAFYFICGRTSNMDADYEPEHPLIQKLMQRMHKRGHEIGLHPSYGTYQPPELIKHEADRLRAACKFAGVQQKQFGGRMHYLRWEHPTTLQAWEDAGMAYDSTLSYADRPGFRCGTCFEYPAFNPSTQQQLKIRIRPLIAMECTIIAERYMGLGYGQAALDKFTDLKDKCRKVNGCFTLLWHNSHFLNKADFEIYEKVLTN